MAEEAEAQRSNRSRERQGRWSSSMSDPNLRVFNLFCTWPVSPETLCPLRQTVIVVCWLPQEFTFSI